MSTKPSSPCPFCQTSLEVIERQAGYAIKCPYCHTPLVLETDLKDVPFFREADPILDDLPLMAPEPLAAVQKMPEVLPRPHLPAEGLPPCYVCGSQRAPVYRKSMSQSGLIVLVVMVMFCFPLFWIGLLMQETIRICPDCGARR